jgi:PAS domain S-box-containing protein
MKSDREPRYFSSFWMALLGFVLGLIVVIAATISGLYFRSLPLSIDSIVQLHLSEPILWAVDVVPFLGAIVLGIFGGRLDESARVRWQAQRAIQHRDQEIQRLNAEVSAQEEARQKLDLTIGRGKRDWEATFDAVGDMILITDVSGKVLRCNRATSHAFQESFENLIGRQIEHLFFGASNGGHFPIPAQKAEMRFPKLTGWYEVSTNPIMVEEGRAATIYVIREITDRKLAVLDLSRQKEYYEALVRNSPFAIVTLNLDQRVVACNPAFESIFGYTEMDVLGQELDPLVAPPDRMEEARALTESVRTGEVVHKITRRRRKDGSQLDVEVYGIPVVLWRKQIGILALYHDISQLIPGRPEEGAASTFAAEPEAELPALEQDSSEDPSPPEIPIETIEGIGRAYSNRLHEAGVRNTTDLLNQAGSRAERRELSAKTGLSPKLILRWVNIADLMRVPGVGKEFSELLVASGVNTVKELRQRVPENLHAAIVEINAEKNLARRAPSLAEVESWVRAAQEMDPVVEY